MISLAENCATESEFQTGKPPAGEAGMCIAKFGSATWTYWDGEQLSDGYRTDCHGGAARTFALYKDGRHFGKFAGWRFATLPELLAAGLTEAEALPMLHKSMLLKDAQDDWGPWIPHKAGDRCPIVDDRRDGYEIRRRSGQEHGANGLSLAERDWGPAGNCIVAYRLKRTAKPPQAPAELWMPERLVGFTEWRESSAYPDGIADKQVLVLLTHERREQRLFNSAAHVYKDADSWSEMYVAYCVRIEATSPIHEEDEEDGGELDIGAILEGLRKHFGGEAFAAAARPSKPKPGLLWERDAVEAVNAALQAKAGESLCQHRAMLERDRA